MVAFTCRYIYPNNFKFCAVKKNYKIIAIDLTKQQALDTDLRAIQKLNFRAILDRSGNVQQQQCFSLLKKRKKLC